jgi:hypothetical protein
MLGSTVADRVVQTVVARHLGEQDRSLGGVGNPVRERLRDEGPARIALLDAGRPLG